MIGAAKAGIDQLDQNLISRYLIIGNLLIAQPAGRVKNNSLHRLLLIRSLFGCSPFGVGGRNLW
jgi:uncharacterized membrane protein